MIFLHSILFVDAGKAFEGLLVAVTANQMMFEHIGCATGRATPTQAILMRTDHQRQLCERSRNESSLLGLDHPLRDISFTARNERKSDQSNQLFKKKCRATKKQLLYRVTEFASALGIKQRTGQLTESQAQAAGMVTLDAVLAKNAKRHKLRPVAV